MLINELFEKLQIIDIHLSSDLKTRLYGQIICLAEFELALSKKGFQSAKMKEYELTLLLDSSRTQ